MSVTIKLVLEKQTGRKAVYSPDGYYFSRPLYVDTVALKQSHRGEVPRVLELEIHIPAEESEVDRIKRETDNELRANAWRLGKKSGN